MEIFHFLYNRKKFCRPWVKRPVFFLIILIWNFEFFCQIYLHLYKKKGFFTIKYIYIYKIKFMVIWYFSLWHVDTRIAYRKLQSEPISPEDVQRAHLPTLLVVFLHVYEGERKSCNEKIFSRYALELCAQYSITFETVHLCYRFSYILLMIFPIHKSVYLVNKNIAI